MPTFISKSGNASVFIDENCAVLTCGTVQLSMSDDVVSADDANYVILTAALETFEAAVDRLRLVDARISITGYVSDDKDITSLLCLTSRLNGSFGRKDRWDDSLSLALRHAARAPMIISYYRKEMMIYPDFDRDVTLRSVVGGVMFAGKKDLFLEWLTPDDEDRNLVSITRP